MPLPPPGIDAESWLALDLIPNLGGESVRRLLKAFGGPRAIFEQPTDSLANIVGPHRAKLVASAVDVERLATTLAWLREPYNHLLTLADDDYPSLLMEILDPPPVLYLKGRRELLGRTCLAVVGSRNATPVGLQNAEAFAKAISEANVTITSGLAMGIDAAAHRGGLAGSASTIAVVGTGLDLVYPARNKALARQIADDGLIISEFALGTPAIAANFPRRNRIISGLSRGVLVVEAALASGSLITARQAADQGRDVFAIPGSIHSPLSKGAHQLIKQGAKLVDYASDVLVELGLQVDRAVADESAMLENGAVRSPLLDAIGFDATSIDELCARTNLSAQALTAQLTELELNGLVAQLDGGKYQRLK